MNLLGLLIAVTLGALITGPVLWITSRFGLGLSVDGLATSFIAGACIAATGGVISWLLNLRKLKPGTGLLGASLNILLGATVLVLLDDLLAGLTVRGFTGAVAACAAAYGICWLLSLVPRSINGVAAARED